MTGPGPGRKGSGAGRETASLLRGTGAGGQTAAARTVTHEEIARYAYRLFEERGRAHGHALDDWVAAERALTREANHENH